jgi:hypothetical protein
MMVIPPYKPTGDGMTAWNAVGVILVCDEVMSTVWDLRTFSSQQSDQRVQRLAALLERQPDSVWMMMVTIDYVHRDDPGFEGTRLSRAITEAFIADPLRYASHCRASEGIELGQLSPEPNSAPWGAASEFVAVGREEGSHGRG